jgi:GcrA cell cycle regulator
MGWTEAKVETLKQLWAEGLSASQCAAELGGLTRNAIIGKVHRLGLQERKARTQARTSPIPKRWNGKHVANAAAAEKPDCLPAAFAPIAGTVSLLELENHHCRWPVGDKFCGNPHANIHRNIPYCPAHARIAGRLYDNRRT